MLEVDLGGWEKSLALYTITRRNSMWLALLISTICRNSVVYNKQQMTCFLLYNVWYEAKKQMIIIEIIELIYIYIFFYDCLFLFFYK
jgi:hypothetical protein